MYISILKKIIFLLYLFIFISCSKHYYALIDDDNSQLLIPDSQLISNNNITILIKKDTSAFERHLLKKGFIKVTEYNNHIQVKLMYSTKDNFLHRDIYKNFVHAYLQKEVALKLIKAQHFLESIKPGYKLIIYDAVRPLSVQKFMWDSIDISPYDKYKYLSNPKYYSLHNYGAAVDVSILDQNNKPLDMGTPYDYFSELAYPCFEKRFLKLGKLTQKQYQNRLLLRNIMTKNHFSGISTEWWHFNSCSMKYAKTHFPLIKDFNVPSEKELASIIDTSENNVKEIHPIINKDTLNLSSNQETKHVVRFKIQIKISKKKLNKTDSIFKNQKVWEYFHEGYYKYTIGTYTDFNKAIKYKNKLHQMGFSDCFVAAFNNNERISIKDAFDLLQEKKANP